MFHPQVSVHIFDTSGASMFTDVRNEFYRDAHGLLIVLDVTRRETFDILSDWVLEIKQEVAQLIMVVHDDQMIWWFNDDTSIMDVHDDLIMILWLDDFMMIFMLVI